MTRIQFTHSYNGQDTWVFQMDPAVARIRATGRIRLLGRHEIPFDEPMQLLFMRHERLERHSNGMRFTALGEDRSTLREEDYFSIGGGFILRGSARASRVSSSLN